MPYFLEYITGVSAGCFTVEGLDFSNALAKAKDALRGLDCLSAALLFSPDPEPIFGGCPGRLQVVSPALGAGADHLKRCYAHRDGLSTRDLDFPLLRCLFR